MTDADRKEAFDLIQQLRGNLMTYATQSRPPT